MTLPRSITEVRYEPPVVDGLSCDCLMDFPVGQASLGPISRDVAALTAALVSRPSSACAIGHA